MYSQFGEDKFIEDYLIKNKIMITPIIVDIGAGDGLFFSNSKLLADKYGYKVYAVDANKEQVAKVKGNIKNCVEAKHALVTGSPFEGKYNMDVEWSLGKVEKAKKGTKTQTLSKIIEAFDITKIGILSIDIEGYDTEVITEYLSNSGIRPELIIIEANTEDDKEAQRKFILKLEYVLLKELGVNSIYIRKDKNI